MGRMDGCHNSDSSKGRNAQRYQQEQNTRSLPFVDLIAGLQNLLPKEARKHGKTRDSLVQALWRARKRMREEQKRREKARQRLVEKERLSRLAYGRNRRVDTR